MVVFGKNFLRPMVSLTGVGRKYSSQKAALAWGSIKYINRTVSLSSNPNRMHSSRYLSTVSNGNTDQNANPLRENLKESQDGAAALVQSLEVLANLFSEKNNELGRCQEKVDALEKQVKSLQNEVATAETKYFIERSLAHIREEIQSFERENGLIDYEPSSEEQYSSLWRVVGEERKIKTDELKWLFLLSPKNPHFVRKENLLLLRTFEKKKISKEKACRAIAVISQLLNPDWNRLERGEYFSFADDNMVVEEVKANRDVFECFLAVKRDLNRKSTA